MHKPESVMGNETLNILVDFEMQTDYKPSESQQKKKFCTNQNL